MALPWPHGTPTLPRPLSVSPTPASPPAPSVRTRRDLRPRYLAHLLAARTRALPGAARVRSMVAEPVTALVAMLAGLVLLFALPLVGLPLVALVVLPLVIFHLRAERRANLRLRR